MQIVILVAVIVCLGASEGQLFEATPWVVVSAIGAYWTITALLSRFSTVWTLRRRSSGQLTGSRFARLLGLVSRGWIILAPAAVIRWGYGDLVYSVLKLRYLPLVGSVLFLVLPAVAAVIHWFFEYPSYRVGRAAMAATGASYGLGVMPVWTRREYLANNVRHHLLFVLVPVSLLLVVTDTLLLHVYPLLPAETRQYTEPATLLFSVGAVFLLFPLVIVRIWRTEPLPQGPLRRKLSETCDQLGVRFGGLLVWKSGGVIANAAVVGLLGRLRYILLSDALLSNCSESHIRAIFAHEAAHILHRHIFYAVVFVSSLMTICHYAGTAGAELLGLAQWAGQGAGAALGLACLVAGFGWLSRRFERQSDVTAAWLSGLPGESTDDADRITVLGASTFAAALDKIALINGIDRYQHNWRHGSIAWRTGYVLDLAARGGTTREITSVVRRAKTALWAAAALAAALVMRDLQAM